MIIPEQRLLFIMILYSAAIGAMLGVIYDVFRIIRIAVSLGEKQKPKSNGKRAKIREAVSFVVIFIEDVLFFIIAAIITILFIFMVNNGQVRLFAVTGEIFGFLLYYFTVGRIVLKLAERIIALIKYVFSLLYRYVVLPPIRLVRYIIFKIKSAVLWVIRYFRAVYIRRKLRAYTQKEMARFISLAETGYGMQP